MIKGIKKNKGKIWWKHPICSRKIKKSWEKM